MTPALLLLLVSMASFSDGQVPPQSARLAPSEVTPSGLADAGVISLDLRARERDPLRRELDIATGVAPGHSTSTSAADPDDIYWDGFDLCGDGVIDGPSEQCDRTDLGGATCTSLGFPGGTLSCHEMLCQFDRSQCAATCPISCTSDADCGSAACGPCVENFCLGAFDGAPTSSQ